MTPTPDDHIRAAARLLSQGCDWSLFLGGLSASARAELLKRLSADAKAPEVRAFVGNLDARRLEVARRCAQEARAPGRFRRCRRRRRNPESRQEPHFRTEPLYDTEPTEPLPTAEWPENSGDFVRRMIRQVAPVAAMIGAQALLGRFAGGFGARRREDYEHGMPCGGGCGQTIRLGDVTIKSMTCMECGAEVCEACIPGHGHGSGGVRV